jgi:hypothetical protein
MDFSSNTDREAIRKGVGDVVRRFGDEDRLGRHDEEIEKT